jgi:hypothetical protein
MNFVISSAVTSVANGSVAGAGVWAAVRPANIIIRPETAIFFMVVAPEVSIF